MLRIGLLLALITATSAVAGDPTLRLGLHTDNQSLRLVLQNIGPADLDVLVGTRTPTNIEYLFNFTATSPAGKHYRIWYFPNRQSLAPALSLNLPELIHLAPQSSQELQFLFQDLIVYLDKRHETPLNHLLPQGYTVTASLEVQQSYFADFHLSAPHLWTGTLTSRYPSTR